jgi:hypothetical protein
VREEIQEKNPGRKHRPLKQWRSDNPDQEVRAYVYGLMGKTTGKSKARDPEKIRAAGLKRWGKAPGVHMAEEMAT